MKQTNYPVGDFLIRIKNAARTNAGEVTVPKTKMIKKVAEALKKEGIVSAVKDKKGELKVKLAMLKKESILMDLKLVSRPGLKIYMGTEELESKKGPEIYILTTPKGILSSKEAIKKGVGGEVIVKIL